MNRPSPTPCRVCGKTNLLWKTHGRVVWWLHCDNCGNVSKSSESRVQAAKNWNSENKISEDPEAEKIFEACAKMALCYPWRLTDPMGVYMQIGFADHSKKMLARLWRVWLKKAAEYPWAVDPVAFQDRIDEYEAEAETDTE